MELPPGTPPIPPGRVFGAPSGGAGRSRQAIAAGALVDSVIVVALHSAGFRRSSTNAVGLLGEVLQRYIYLIAQGARENSESAQRTVPHLRDVCASLGDIGVDLEDLLEWLPSSSASATMPASIGPEASAISSLRLRAAALTRPEEARSPQLGPILDYLPRDPVVRRHALEAENAMSATNFEPDAESDAKAMDLDSNSEDISRRESPVSPYSPPSTVSAEDGCSDYEFEHRPQQDLLPPHLPPLPSGYNLQTGLETPPASKMDPTNPTTPLPEPQPKEGNQEPKENGSARADVTQSSESLLRIPSAASLPSTDARVRTSDVDEVPFSSSRFTQEHGPNSLLDLPQLDPSISKRPKQSVLFERDSALYAYAANLRALQAEPSSSAVANLKIDDADTSLPDPAMRLARTKRRRIAATVADVGQFAPADTLYAGVPVRANSPFVPSPSILVTAPPPVSTVPGEPPPNNAPLLSLTHPHGQSVALAPPSGALQPVLGYRWPSQVASAAMAVADHDVRRHVSRMADPGPLLDDKGTERVFHGKPAPKHLLSLSYGSLAPAINEMRSNWQAAHPGQVFTEPQRGTLVYTWDWSSRDFWDRNLPGKSVLPEDQPLFAGSKHLPSMMPSSQQSPTALRTRHSLGYSARSSQSPAPASAAHPPHLPNQGPHHPLSRELSSTPPEDEPNGYPDDLHRDQPRRDWSDHMDFSSPSSPRSPARQHLASGVPDHPSGITSGPSGPSDTALPKSSIPDGQSPGPRPRNGALPPVSSPHTPNSVSGLLAPLSRSRADHGSNFLGLNIEQPRQWPDNDGGNAMDKEQARDESFPDSSQRSHHFSSSSPLRTAEEDHKPAAPRASATQNGVRVNDSSGTSPSR